MTEAIQYMLIGGGAAVMLLAVAQILWGRWRHPCDCGRCRTERLLLKEAAYQAGWRAAERKAASDERLMMEHLAARN